MVSHAFSALCVYSTFGHHPHPLGYLSVKFYFFYSQNCWASPWRKIAYLITQSPSLFDAPGTEAIWNNKIVTNFLKINEHLSWGNLPSLFRLRRLGKSRVADWNVNSKQRSNDKRQVHSAVNPDLLHSLEDPRSITRHPGIFCDHFGLDISQCNTTKFLRKTCIRF